MKKNVSSILTSLLMLTILLTGCGSKQAFLQESTKTENKDIETKLSKYMKDFSIENEFSGTILVAKAGDVLLNRGYGMADYDKRIINKPQTVFEIGSITKQFTATAILMLQEKKLLNIKDKISKYIPDYPNGNKIEIYNLLTHTSGIPEYLEFVKSLESGKRTYNSKELIELFENKPLNFETGALFEYSNSNYILLGYIIEKVSGMKYEDYIIKSIFNPLDLNNTGLLSKKITINNKAFGYSMIDSKSNKYLKTLETESTLPYSAGEIYSTIEDLYRWNEGLFTYKLINKESLNKMLTPNLNSYGYGWFINKSNDGSKIIFHGGSIPGYTSYIVKNINKEYVIIILSNKDKDYNVTNVTMGLTEILEMKK